MQTRKESQRIFYSSKNRPASASRIIAFTLRVSQADVMDIIGVQQRIYLLRVGEMQELLHLPVHVGSDVSVSKEFAPRL